MAISDTSGVANLSLTASAAGGLSVRNGSGESTISIGSISNDAILVHNSSAELPMSVDAVANQAVHIIFSSGVALLKFNAKSSSATLVKGSLGSIKALMTSKASNPLRVMVSAGISTIEFEADAFVYERDIATALNESVPDIFTDIEEFNLIQKAQSVELHRLGAKREQQLRDFSFVDDTSLPGIILFENGLKLPVDETKSLTARREAVKKRLQGPGLITDSVFEDMVNQFYDSTVDQDRANSTVKTTIWSKRGIPDNIKEMEAAVDEALPIYLEHEFIPTWLTWGEIEDYGLTGEEAETYTSGELSETFLFPYSGIGGE